jgi:hypothetical protein
MYESIVVIINDKKYILTYNTNALSVSELMDIINYEVLDIEEDFDAVNEVLQMEYDSELAEYTEYRF